MLSNVQIKNFKINNKVIVYLIIFFILLPLAYIKNTLSSDLNIFTNPVLRLIILLLIILTCLSNNVQIALSLAIFYIFINIYKNSSFENFKSLNKKYI